VVSRYFHRPPSFSGQGITPVSTVTDVGGEGGYRGGTRKGMDLTFGPPLARTYDGQEKTRSTFFTISKEQPSTSTSTLAETPAVPESTTFIHGGVLLRTLRRVKDQKVTSGPSLLVDEVLRAHSGEGKKGAIDGIKELVTDVWDNDIWAFNSPTEQDLQQGKRMMVMRTRPAMPKAKKNPFTGATEDVVVYRSPRIGLDLAHRSIPLPSSAGGSSATLKHSRTRFIARPYRCFTHPNLLVANGKPQTFLGVLNHVLQKKGTNEQKIPNSRLVAEVVKRTGMKEATAKPWVETYTEAQNFKKEGDDTVVKELKEFIGPKGKNISGQSVRYIGMVGVLGKLLASQ
jgi:hypothetical protein